MKRKWALLGVLLSGCSLVYPRWANGVSTIATPAGDRSALALYTDRPESGSFATRQVEAGGYVRFVIERLCVTELPGAFGDEESAYLGITMVGDPRTTGDTLTGAFFAELSASAGEDAEQSRARIGRRLQDYAVRPVQRIVTNERGCISLGYSTPPLPLESVADRPRMLFSASVLYGEEVQQFLRRAGDAAESLEGLEVLGIGEYLAKAAEITDVAASFLAAIRPHRVILWFESSFPVALETNGRLTIPSAEQRFVYLFTDPHATSLDGESSDRTFGAPRTQSEVEAAARQGRILARSDAWTVEEHTQRGDRTYGAPYLVWRVEWIPEPELARDFYRPVMDVLRSAKNAVLGASYNQWIDELHDRRTASSAYLSLTHRSVLADLEEQLRRIVGGTLEPGSRDRVCDARDALERVRAMRLAERWGAPAGLDAELAALSEAHAARATERRIECGLVGLQPLVEDPRVQGEAFPAGLAADQTIVLGAADARRTIARLVIPRGATIRFADDVREVDWRVERLEFGEGATIDLAAPASASTPARVGTTVPSQPRHGIEGASGTDGSPGAGGAAGRTLRLHVERSYRPRGSLWIRTDGAAGQVGGAGGAGQMGGGTSCGRCMGVMGPDEPHTNGGRGGNGGDGGAGGQGGATGQVVTNLPAVALPCRDECGPSARPATATGDSGAIIVYGGPGCGGSGGAGGVRGPGGGPNRSCTCNDDVVAGTAGEAGDSGPNGAPGACSAVHVMRE